MNLTYEKYVRFTLLLCFIVSSVVSIKLNSHPALVVALSALCAFIGFECMLRYPQAKEKQIDYTPEIQQILDILKQHDQRADALDLKFKEIKDNISLGSIASAITRR
jgi:hypothetical protein